MKRAPRGIFHGFIELCIARNIADSSACARNSPLTRRACHVRWLEGVRVLCIRVVLCIIIHLITSRITIYGLQHGVRLIVRIALILELMGRSDDGSLIRVFTGYENSPPGQVSARGSTEE